MNAKFECRFVYLLRKCNYTLKVLIIDIDNARDILVDHKVCHTNLTAEGGQNIVEFMFLLMTDRQTCYYVKS